jgi:hypothetical protein
MLTLLISQILSSENWTDILTTVISSEKGQFQIVVACVFLCGWMFFSFCAPSFPLIHSPSST